MRLHISHLTTYTYAEPVDYALQRLRLIPRSGHGQTVIEWDSKVTGGTKQAAFDDAFMNHSELVKVDEGATEVTILSKGVVEVQDRSGVVGTHMGYAPLWLFTHGTSKTAAGNAVRQLAARVRNETAELDEVARLHHLSTAIAEAVAYEVGHTDTSTTAEAALAAGRGVCQDQAHVMIAVARAMGLPARYVSGYLFMESQEEQEASHAWCEVWTQSLGWIGFDVANTVCPDGRYIRVATGRDYDDAAPVSGIRRGDAAEGLHVSLQVQQ